MNRRSNEEVPDQEVAILLSDAAKSVYATLPGDKQRQIAGFMRKHLNPEAVENDPELDLPGLGVEGLHLALDPVGSAIVYRPLTDREADQIEADHGYLIADVIADFTTTGLALAAMPLVAITADAIAALMARSVAEVISRRLIKQEVEAPDEEQSAVTANVASD